MRKLLGVLLILLAAMFVGCGTQTPEPEQEELKAGDIYWVCDISGENCECRTIGASECPEVE